MKRQRTKKTWIEVGNIDIEYKNELYDVAVEGEFYSSMEGQDADGNRGVMMTFCDGWEIVDIVPDPPSKEALHYIEEAVYAMNMGAILWSGSDDSGGYDDYDPAEHDTFERPREQDV